jgi:ferredoxin-nitrite reductase
MTTVVRDLSKIDRLKARKDGLDTLDDIYRYAREGFDRIPPEEYDLLKWFGLFHRKQTPGRFMMRLRVSNGALSTSQLRAIAGISGEFGRGVGDITTRQGIQLRWIEIENVPEIFERLHRVGLTTQQTGMDNFRNVVGCPMAGVLADETLDASPTVQALALSLMGREFSNLPRKFNIAVSGCPVDCTEANNHDIGFYPAIKRAGDRSISGFNVMVGGALGGKSPMMAVPLDAFVLPEQVIPLCRAILKLFRDNGNRSVRTRARLKWLLADWGLARFRDEVTVNLGEPLVAAGESQVRRFGGDHLGVTPQKQRGLNTVGLVVPVGRITASQLLILADLADRYGSREVRLTVTQNVLIPNVHDPDLAALLAEPLLETWSPHAPVPVAGLTTCTGNDYCHFALGDTKSDALEIARAIEKRLPDSIRQMHLNVSGCINACGRHRSRDFGLVSAQFRKDGETVPAFHIFKGGRLGEHDAKVAELVQENVPIDEIADVLAREIIDFYGNAAGD